MIQKITLIGLGAMGRSLHRDCRPAMEMISGCLQTETGRND